MTKDITEEHMKADLARAIIAAYDKHIRRLPPGFELDLNIAMADAERRGDFERIEKYKEYKENIEWIRQAHDNLCPDCRARALNDAGGNA